MLTLNWQWQGLAVGVEMGWWVRLILPPQEFIAACFHHPQNPADALHGRYVINTYCSILSALTASLVGDIRVLVLSPVTNARDFCK